MKLNAAQRKAIYAAVAALAGLSVAFGLITAEELALTADSITRLLTAIATMLGSFLAMANITPDDQE